MFSPAQPITAKLFLQTRTLPMSLDAIFLPRMQPPGIRGHTGMLNYSQGFCEEDKVAILKSEAVTFAGI